MSSSTAIEIEPGDEVMVHGAPTAVPFGERLVVRRSATVVRAGPLERLLAHGSRAISNSPNSTKSASRTGGQS